MSHCAGEYVKSVRTKESGKIYSKCQAAQIMTAM